MTTRKNASNTSSSKSAPQAENKEFVISGTRVNSDTPVKFATNPKRVNSRAWERYEKYQSATTFGQYLELNPGKFSMADARHDLGKGFLTLPESE